MHTLVRTTSPATQSNGNSPRVIKLLVALVVSPRHQPPQQHNLAASNSLDLSIASRALHDANSIAGSTSRRGVVRIEERARRAVPSVPIGRLLPRASVMSVSIAASVFILNVSIAASVLVLHKATTQHSGRRGGLRHRLGLGGAFRVVIAAVHDLEATGQRALAARAAEAVGVEGLAVHMQALAISAAKKSKDAKHAKCTAKSRENALDLALAAGTAQHADGAARTAVGGRLVGVLERALRAGPAHGVCVSAGELRTGCSCTKSANFQSETSTIFSVHFQQTQIGV
ncbi:unnamed protein product [Phytophthora lilii]|uniref:Unnamed protein product n=1 Tax=Phytophthora lilii TaxID=2077276 RepID=A0A9W6TRU1_9STRA|nr:unnamed protein product [Phytophthora lilii]